jgi:hypothetical protein
VPGRFDAVREALFMIMIRFSVEVSVRGSGDGDEDVVPADVDRFRASLSG